MSDVPANASYFRSASAAKKIRLILSAPFAFLACGLLLIGSAISGDYD